MLSGRKHVETWNAAFATILNVLLAIVLVPRYGLTGAALATTAAFCLLNVLRLWQVRRIVGLRTFRPYFLRFAVSAGAGLGAHGALQWAGLFQGADALSLFLRIAVALAADALALWTIGLVPKDKDMLRSTLLSMGRRGLRSPRLP